MRKAGQQQAGLQAGLGDLVAAFWRSLGSPRAIFYLLVIIAACSVVGIVIPQGQPPQHYIHKYDELASSVIRHLRLDHLYSSAWYVILLTLLPLNVIARAKQIWGLRRRDSVEPELSVLQRRLQADSTASVEGSVASDLRSTQAALATGLCDRGYKVEAAVGGDEFRWLIGRKRPYAAFGIILVHFSVLAIAVGAVLGQWPGLAVNKTIQIAEGETYIDPDGDFEFALKLNDFSIEYYPQDGSVKAYKSDLTILDRGQEAKRKTVVVNQPLTYDHFSFFQHSWGLAGFTLRVRPISGAVEVVKLPLAVTGGNSPDRTRYYQVPLQECQAFIGDGQRTIIATAFVPDAVERDGEIVGSQSEFPKNPAVRLTLASRSITRRLDLIDLGWVRLGQVATCDGGTIQLADVRHFASFMVRRDYGVPVVWLGFVALFVGLVMTFYLRPHTVLAKLTETGQQVKVALAALEGTSTGAEPVAQQPATVLEGVINSVNRQLARSGVEWSTTKRNEARVEVEAESAGTEEALGGRRGRAGLWVRNLPSLAALDQLSYNIVAFAFPLLTLVIITGAVWGQAAWGRWWHWDPKETAALVTWLIYAAYLHGRLRRGWCGGPAAAFAIIGFATVLFCFAGIGLIPSLHSHGRGSEVGGWADISLAETWLTQVFITGYVLAMLAYSIFAATRNLIVGKAATMLAGIGLLTLTAVLTLRTHEAGRLPLTSRYDFALCFVWCISIVHLVVEQTTGTKALGPFVVIIVLGLTMYACMVLPAKASIPLLPALQNRLWLHVHVLVAMVAFGALALSCATGIMYFVKRRALATASVAHRRQ